MGRFWCVVIAIPALFAGIILNAQSNVLVESVAGLTGVGSVEYIDSEEMERFEKFHSDPVDINASSYMKLKEIGLFSEYQLASLYDYRKEHGNIMSLRELSMLDGFSEEFVRLISPFISVDQQGEIFMQDGVWRHKSTVRVGLKPSQYLYTYRYGAEKKDRFNCTLSVNHGYGADKSLPVNYSGGLSFSSGSDRLRLVIGAFNARFGQGLTLWNGMTVGGISSTAGFYKKQSGISLSSSFTGSMALKGIALECRPGRWSVMMMGSFSFSDGLSAGPAVNVSRTFRTGRIGVTHVATVRYRDGQVRIPEMNTAVDAAWCFRGTDVFAELAYDWVNVCPAFISGVAAPLSESVRVASMLRYYPSGFSSAYGSAHRSLASCTNEYAFSLAGDFSFGSMVAFAPDDRSGTAADRIAGHVSADIAHFPVRKTGDRGKSVQMKVMTRWTWIISRSFKADIKVTERIRTWGRPFKTEVRSDLSYIRKRMSLILRTDVSRCAGTGVLAYMEGGYRSEQLGVYLRQGLFFIDNWDDMIYAYERDAPGNFSVPAFYGRGVWTSFYGSWKPMRWMKVYLRASMTLYPFMSQEKKKPGKAELKLQTVFTF